MVAPVLDFGTDTVEEYLPAGVWVHLWIRLGTKLGRQGLL
jgi:alpha-glucosidase (family GH31 glycosyl hydrolase)